MLWNKIIRHTYQSMIFGNINNPLLDLLPEKETIKFNKTIGDRIKRNTFSGKPDLIIPSSIIDMEI